MKRSGDKKKEASSSAKTKIKNLKKQPDKKVQLINDYPKPLFKDKKINDSPKLFSKSEKTNDYPKLISKDKKINKSTWLYILGGVILLALIILAVYFIIEGKTNKEDLSVSNITKKVVIIGDRQFIFAKEGNSTNAPVIIFLHGGAQDNNIWFAENDQALIVKEALDKGYAVIAPDSLKPLCENVKQWDYRKNSSDLVFFDDIFNYIWSRDDLDSDRIYISGISIGGFMASRLAEHYGDSINAIAIYAGGNADNLFVDPTNLCYVEYGYNFTSIRADHPRTLLIHGDNDTTIPIEAPLKYYEALKEAGRGAKMIIKVQGEHRWYPEYNEDILNWFN
jgi:poly(3-hydroxybutyrate) depolymerase